MPPGSSESGYDRDVISVDTNYQTTSKSSYSKQSQLIFTERKKIHRTCDPKKYSHDKINCYHANPIVIALDVTGSMGDQAKIIYDKLPNPSISFCGIGDARSDEAPLQGKKIDEIISKIWLEGGGGGNGIESYELAAYFYSRKCDIRTAELPFIFFTGDEGIYETVQKDRLKDEFDMDEEEDIKTKDIFAELKKSFKVFHLHIPYFDKEVDQKTVEQWSSLIGPENVIIFKNPKAVSDMKNRMQSVERIKEVSTALSKLDVFDEVINDLKIESDLSFFRNAPNSLQSPDSVKLPPMSMNLPSLKKKEKFYKYQKDNLIVKALFHSDGTFHTFNQYTSEDKSYQAVSFGIFYAPNLMLMQVLAYAVWDSTDDGFHPPDEQPTNWTPASSESWKYSYSFDGSTVQVFNITPEKEELLTLNEEK